MNKAFKYRIYPNEKQTEYFNKCFGCCRYIYNQGLKWRTLAYNADKTSLNYNDTAFGLTSLKRQTPWLKEVDSIGLQQALKHLNTAFDAFFHKKAKYPKYKSKRHSKKSYTTINQNGTITVYEDAIKLPKAGNVKAMIHRKPPEGYVLKSAVISQECDGSYYCSCLYEYEDNISAHKVTYENTIGLDYKTDGLYVSSEGKTCGSPKYYRKSQKKLAKLQQKLKNKVLHSNNYNKQQNKISKLHRHIANQRADFLHKKSFEIANRYDLVCVEDINLRNMSNKDFGNGKATTDNGFGMFLNMLEYKLSYFGKTLIKVDKYYPSSQLCSCGYQNSITKNLNIRTIKCPVCHRVYDRDVNAAVNIKNEGYRLYLQTVI